MMGGLLDQLPRRLSARPPAAAPGQTNPERSRAAMGDPRPPSNRLSPQQSAESNQDCCQSPEKGSDRYHNGDDLINEQSRNSLERGLDLERTIELPVKLQPQCRR